MRRFHRQFDLILYCALGVIALIGCRAPKERIRLEATGVESRPYVDVFNDVYDLQSDAQSITECDLVESDLAQPVLRSEQIPEARHEISLNEVVRIGLSNAKVLKDLNARILDNPAVVASRHDPAIRATDPTFGIAAALSDFDTRLTADVNYQNNDQVFNNAVLGGGANTLRQDLTVGNIGFERTLMNGASYAIRGNSQHDDNDRPGNLFPSSWRTRLEMEMRQPLMQGRGATFNQIFGPTLRSRPKPMVSSLVGSIRTFPLLNLNEILTTTSPR